jgi:hypothetical protein
MAGAKAKSDLGGGGGGDGVYSLYKNQILFKNELFECLKNQKSLSFLVLKIFYFYFCPDTYASPVIRNPH